MRFHITPKFSRWMFRFQRTPHFWCICIGRRDLLIYWRHGD